MLIALVTQWMHDGDHMGRGWWWLMGIGWLVFLGLLAVLGLVLIRHFTTKNGGTRSAQGILAERFARGEIDEQEYQKRRDALR